MKHTLVLLLAFLEACAGVDAARILGLFNYPGKSHFIMFEQAMKTLAARGHEVVVYSHFPQENPVPNYKDVSLVGSLPSIVNAFPIDEMFGRADIYFTLNLLEMITVDECEKLLQFPAMQELIKSNEKFDLIFTEAFVTDCMLPFVYKFQAPNIAMVSSIVMPWSTDRFGLPDNPAYLPIQFVLSSDHMSFFERLSNTWYLLYSKCYYYKYIDAPTNEIVKKFFGPSIPPLKEIAKNTSLFFINSNPALNPPRPLVPAVIEVGGLHLKAPQKLPQDIQKFLDDAEHGAVFFTFGSTVKAKDLTEAKRKAILEAFSELPQRVLWKWEDDTLQGQPPNLLVRKWLPQREILNHPKTKLFITHGGLMGTIEAVHAGVPMLGIPLFGDQPSNVMICVRRGIARFLGFHEISKKTLLESIRAILNDPGYKQRTEQVSRAYKDTYMSPRESLVFWSEYVLRHNGAPHLRSAAVDLQWYQLLLLDVVAFVLAACLAVVAVAFVLCRAVLRRLSLLSRAPDRNKQKKQ